MKNSSPTIQAVPEMQRFLQKHKPNIRTKQPVDFSLEKYTTPRIRTKQLAEFTRQLATLLEARLSLTRALEILAEQSTHQRLKKILDEILTQIRGGQSFSNCLKSHPRVFSEFFVSLVEVGEQGGILEQTLNRLANYLEKLDHLQRKVLTALTYPLVIVLVAMGAVTFLLVAVVPTFADMFEGFGGQLPGPTRFLLELGTFVKSNFWLIAGLATLTAIVLVRLTKTPKGSVLRDKLLLKLPFIRALLKKSFLAKFCRTLGTLLNSGVTLVDALQVAGKVSKNQIFRNAIRKMKARIIEGHSILPANSSIEPFSPLTIQMIRVGEETGQLAEMLLKVAGFYEAELDATIEAMTSIIEPVIIVFLGVVLGGTLIAMYLQLFNLVDVIQ